MSKRAYTTIMAGLESARAYLDGTADKRRYRVHDPRKRKARVASSVQEKRIRTILRHARA